MNPQPTLRSPKWPFLLGDGILFALACIVGALAPSPISTGMITIVFACLSLGALLGVAPFVLDYLSSQRASVQELQTRLSEQTRQLQMTAEGLASTVGQIKSAHEAAGRAVFAAEALPHRMQEKMTEFTAQLQERDEEDKTRMAKELAQLRATEGQSLAALVATIQKAIKDFVSIEEKTRGAFEAARNLNAEVAPRLTEATSRAELALRQASTQLQGSIDATDARARDTLAAIEAAAQRLLERTAALGQTEQELDSGLAQRIEQLQAAAQAITASAEIASEWCRASAAALEQARLAGPSTVEAGNSPSPFTSIPLTQLSAFPLKRREIHAVRPAAAPEVEIPAVAEAPAAQASASTEPSASEPAPKREPRRKSSSRSLGEAVLPGFADPEVPYDSEPTSHTEPAKTSDGTTRLLVTAFVGIGNKIFVRGEGPGLSWEKGIPLEFVSIGKWSWETAEAAEAVTLQLYKNDDLAAQGDVITIPPGHHIEATPIFRESDPF